MDKEQRLAGRAQELQGARGYQETASKLANGLEVTQRERPGHGRDEALKQLWGGHRAQRVNRSP